MLFCQHITCNISKEVLRFSLSFSPYCILSFQCPHSVTSHWLLRPLDTFVNPTLFLLFGGRLHPITVECLISYQISMTLSIVEAITEEGAPPRASFIDTYSYFFSSMLLQGALVIMNMLICSACQKIDGQRLRFNFRLLLLDELCQRHSLYQICHWVIIFNTRTSKKSEVRQKRF